HWSFTANVDLNGRERPSRCGFMPDMTTDHELPHNTARKPARDLQRAKAEVRAAWNESAAFWDQRMGDGNEFVEVLVWPATERLLDLRPGERVLDVACGSGLSSRRLAGICDRRPGTAGLCTTSRSRIRCFTDRCMNCSACALP